MKQIHLKTDFYFYFYFCFFTVLAEFFVRYQTFESFNNNKKKYQIQLLLINNKAFQLRLIRSGASNRYCSKKC